MVVQQPAKTQISLHNMHVVCPYSQYALLQISQDLLKP